MSRHTCYDCGRKREAKYMKKLPRYFDNGNQERWYCSISIRDTFSKSCYDSAQILRITSLEYRLERMKEYWREKSVP